MNVMRDLLAPWQWSLLLAVPPAIVLLYFLKLRREPLEVPSTFLWQRAVEDMHVNSIWQRLRQNLLLFLQLLLVLLTILACLNPNWNASRLADSRVIFLIDNSASMSATDVVPTRLEDAKQQVRALVEAMESGDTAMIITFSDDARTIQSYTDNRPLLLRKLAMVQPTHRRTDLQQALQFAAGLANPGRSAYGEGDAAAAEAKPASLYIFSDGNVQHDADFALGNLSPTYMRIGTSSPKNVGITAFQTAVHPERLDELQVLATVRNYGPETVTILMNLSLDGRLVDAATVEIEGHGQSGTVFQLVVPDDGVLHLTIDHDDALSIDNQAYSVLDRSQPVRVLIVSNGNDFLELAFATPRMQAIANVRTVSPNYLESDEYQANAVSGAFDLVVFDQCAPDTSARMPMSDTLFFGAHPPGALWGSKARQSQPNVIDTDRSHPLMQFVEMSNLVVADCDPLITPIGATILVDADVGPLLAIADRDGFQDLVVAFSVIGHDAVGNAYFNTLWPRDPSFPVFMQNVVSYIGDASLESQNPSYQPGELITWHIDTLKGRLQLRTPEGSEQEIGRGGSGNFAFADSKRIGIYEPLVPDNPDVRHRVAINLFDEIESDLSPAQKLQIDEHVSVDATPALVRKRIETWKPLLLLALVVLAAEWYIYHRRIYL